MSLVAANMDRKASKRLIFVIYIFTGDNFFAKLRLADASLLRRNKICEVKFHYFYVFCPRDIDSTNTL